MLWRQQILDSMKPAIAKSWKKVSNGTAASITNVPCLNYLLGIVPPACISMKHCNSVSTLLNQLVTKIQFASQVVLLQLRRRQRRQLLGPRNATPLMAAFAKHANPLKTSCRWMNAGQFTSLLKFSMTSVCNTALNTTGAWKRIVFAWGPVKTALFSILRPKMASILPKDFALCRQQCLHV